MEREDRGVWAGALRSETGAVGRGMGERLAYRRGKSDVRAGETYHERQDESRQGR